MSKLIEDFAAAMARKQAGYVEQMAAALMLELERNGIAADTPIENIVLVQERSADLQTWTWRFIVVDDPQDKPTYCMYCRGLLHVVTFLDERFCTKCNKVQTL